MAETRFPARPPVRVHQFHHSKSYPGLFIVVDVSRKSEDGLPLAVSALIRIQNETKFSVELWIRREQMEDEFASVIEGR
ncbi:hypothetical protein CRYUN_Cryun22dG0104900 [Craigia yunnanensis]